jgi:hypothetical protein
MPFVENPRFQGFEEYRVLWGRSFEWCSAAEHCGKGRSGIWGVADIEGRDLLASL